MLCLQVEHSLSGIMDSPPVTASLMPDQRKDICSLSASSPPFMESM